MLEGSAPVFREQPPQQRRRQPGFERALNRAPFFPKKRLQLLGIGGSAWSGLWGTIRGFGFKSGFWPFWAKKSVAPGGLGNELAGL